MKFYIFNIFIVIITLFYQSTLFWCGSHFAIEHSINIEEEASTESEENSNSNEKDSKILTSLPFCSSQNTIINGFLFYPGFLKTCCDSNHSTSIEIPPEA